MVKKYLLDTNVLIALFTGKYGVQRSVFEHGLENCLVSELSLGELYVGAFKSNSAMVLEQINYVKRVFEVLPFSDAAEEFGRIRRQRLSDGIVHILIQGSRKDVGREPGPEQGHAYEVLLENGHVEFPIRVAQVIPPVGGIVFQGSLMNFDQGPDVAGDGAGTAAERHPFLALVLRQFPGEILGIGIVVLLRLGDELQFPQKLLAFLVHDRSALHPV